MRPIERKSAVLPPPESNRQPSFPFAEYHFGELRGGALDLKNVPALQELVLTISSYYGRIETLAP